VLDVRPLPDGGLLVSLGGRSHLVYTKEESSGLRLVLNGATCQFSNEYDPTTLRAPMSGKLARYLVEDGARVAAGQPYVEVEVMKMYMSLNAPEAGTLQLLKPDGSLRCWTRATHGLRAPSPPFPQGRRESPIFVARLPRRGVPPS
jgi:acetyl-CoA carboxylase/biotin carboxylase 1